MSNRKELITLADKKWQQKLTETSAKKTKMNMGKKIAEGSGKSNPPLGRVGQHSLIVGGALRNFACFHKVLPLGCCFIVSQGVAIGCCFIVSQGGAIGLGYAGPSAC